jgi:hypothetical protein
VRIVRKLIALAVYAALLMPLSENKLTSWFRAIEVTSTALDRTMRRRRSQMENDRFARILRVLQEDAEYEERTLSGRIFRG